MKKNKLSSRKGRLSLLYKYIYKHFKCRVQIWVIKQVYVFYSFLERENLFVAFSGIICTICCTNILLFLCDILREGSDNDRSSRWLSLFCEGNNKHRSKWFSLCHCWPIVSHGHSAMKWAETLKCWNSNQMWSRSS